MDTGELKSEQRRAASLARRSLSAPEAAEKSAAIIGRITGLDAFKDASVVLTYCPTPQEADISSLSEVQNKLFAYPMVTGCDMVSAVPADDGAWIEGSFGIRQPDAKNSRIIPPERIDAVIVPLVAFDAGCMRVGHGGGYYDRYLSQCQNAVFIGAAFELQRVERAAAEPHDIRLDCVVTEARIYRAASPEQK